MPAIKETGLTFWVNVYVSAVVSVRSPTQRAKFKFIHNISLFRTTFYTKNYRITIVGIVRKTCVNRGVLTDKLVSQLNRQHNFSVYIVFDAPTNHHHHHHHHHKLKHKTSVDFYAKIILFRQIRPAYLCSTMSPLRRTRPLPAAKQTNTICCLVISIYHDRGRLMAACQCQAGLVVGRCRRCKTAALRGCRSATCWQQVCASSLAKPHSSHTYNLPRRCLQPQISWTPCSLRSCDSSEQRCVNALSHRLHRYGRTPTR